jgi:hypothetical protein
MGYCPLVRLDIQEMPHRSWGAARKSGAPKGSLGWVKAEFAACIRSAGGFNLPGWFDPMEGA